MIDCDPSTLPSRPGAYALEFRLTRSIHLAVGRLGKFELEPGVLRYYGSARGPGGLRGRILRHLSPDGRRDRWHVDVLTRNVRVDRVWIDFALHECDLVRIDLDTGWRVAVPDFGSSDCRTCPTHLLCKATLPG